ncbi:hypothetical protein STEG23_021070 [Scotinomys teguina]
MITGRDKVFMKQPKLTYEGVTDCSLQYSDSVDAREKSEFGQLKITGEAKERTLKEMCNVIHNDKEKKTSHKANNKTILIRWSLNSRNAFQGSEVTLWAVPNQNRLRELVATGLGARCCPLPHGPEDRTQRPSVIELSSQLSPLSSVRDFLEEAIMPHLRAYEVQQLLHNKFVVILGDSIQRAVYKDLVLLLQKDCLLSSSQLKSKGELSFEHDVLLEGGRRGPMHNGTHYHEVRQFCSGHHLVRFYFLTRAYSPYVEDILQQLHWGEYAPDLVVMNSCLWDLSKYKHNFRRRYRDDLKKLFRRLDQLMPASCLLVWNTTMPVAEVITGSLVLPDAPACPSHMRRDVMEANFYSSVEAVRRGFDVLDLHFHFRHARQHRLSDGVHWDERAHRCLSQLLLAHVADAWGVVLPARNPVGRWIRDVPDEGQSDRAERRAERRQPRDHHRWEQREPPVSRRSSSPSSSHSTGIPRGAGMDVPGKPTLHIVKRGQALSAESIPITITESRPHTLPGTTVSHTDPIEGTVIDGPKHKTQGLQS